MMPCIPNDVVVSVGLPNGARSLTFHVYALKKNVTPLADEHAFPLMLSSIPFFLIDPGGCV